MSNAPQKQNPQAQKNEYSNQSKPAQVGKKDESTAQGGMKATSDNKSSQSGTKPSNA